ncbi:uncharacterized protein TNCV_723451 [Trichonephila clavipes]|nr:uncharacterized protein TNCV_723451 [Trichonephila clavipes]
MPRQKRSSLVSKQKANKRWCSEHYSHETDVYRKDETSISSALPERNMRCQTLEDSCLNDLNCCENSEAPHYVIMDKQFLKAALARGEVPGPHVKHVKTPLKETRLGKIMPIYQRLASNELLQRCIRCVTQNANESLHSIIWGKCSKETSATLRRVTIAVCDAVCEFNFGTKKSLENLQKEKGLASNKQSKMLAVWRDYRRVYQKKRKRLAVYAIARKKIALAKKWRNVSFIKKEGITYERGGF